jgi:hypothetical protein
MSDPRNKPISELDLSVRSRRIIEMFKLKTVGDLCQKTEAELMACPNFGQTSAERDQAEAGRARREPEGGEVADPCTTSCAARWSSVDRPTSSWTSAASATG